ncbi:oxidoreductase [Isoptericola sp. 178]|uniref:oxidoreductase n=1 Tax=Isoptericola sp. 178 TaxID=3064651 RepID=UPI002713C5DB|nr:oxidoreductase [Isoptericola sp. 178]MDO8143290.1 oxidoreductase [Isoptericola sp. 178]
MTDSTPHTARQEPLGTPFGYRSSADDVLAEHDLTGRRAVVTGGYSGLGIETVRALTARGATAVVPARRPAAAAEALADVDGVEVHPLDLSDLDSVAAFARTLRGDGRPVDLLINAAAVMATPEGRTAQGWETQFGTNHLGHFALVGGVAPLLTPGARVVSYSSIGHFRSPVRFDDLGFDEEEYDPWVAYGQSKSANALFAVGLDARADAGVHAYSVHPGGIMTELQRHMSTEEKTARGWIDADGNPNPLFKTPAQGAATALWAATAPELESRGGVYCEDCDVAALVADDTTDVRAGGVKHWAVDPAAADRLWALSVEATGVEPFAA